jgi:hypothetical protein
MDRSGIAEAHLGKNSFLRRARKARYVDSTWASRAGRQLAYSLSERMSTRCKGACHEACADSDRVHHKVDHACVSPRNHELEQLKRTGVEHKCRRDHIDYNSGILLQTLLPLKGRS